MEITNVSMVDLRINKKIRNGARTITIGYEVNNNSKLSGEVTIDTDYMGLDYTAADCGSALNHDVDKAVAEVLKDKTEADVATPETIALIKAKIEENWFGCGAYHKLLAPTSYEATIRPKRLMYSLANAF